MITWPGVSGGLADLEDAAEQIVCLSQELDSGQATGYPGHDRVW